MHARTEAVDITIRHAVQKSSIAVTFSLEKIRFVELLFCLLFSMSGPKIKTYHFSAFIQAADTFYENAPMHHNRIVLERQR